MPRDGEGLLTLSKDGDLLVISAFDKQAYLGWRGDAIVAGTKDRVTAVLAQHDDALAKTWRDRIAALPTGTLVMWSAKPMMTALLGVPTTTFSLAADLVGPRQYSMHFVVGCASAEAAEAGKQQLAAGQVPPGVEPPPAIKAGLMRAKATVSGARLEIVIDQDTFTDVDLPTLQAWGRKHEVAVAVNAREVDLGGHPGLWLAPRGATALYVLAHGAGAGMRHAFMDAIAAVARASARSRRCAGSFRSWRPARPRVDRPRDRRGRRARGVAAAAKSHQLPRVRGRQVVRRPDDVARARRRAACRARDSSSSDFRSTRRSKPGVERAEHLVAGGRGRCCSCRARATISPTSRCCARSSRSSARARRCTWSTAPITGSTRSCSSRTHARRGRSGSSCARIAAG